MDELKNEILNAEQQRGMYVHPAAMMALVAILSVLLTMLVVNGPGSGRQPAQGPGQATAVASAAGLQLYYSTMHPWIVQDHPGTCPICGMELVKMPADEQAKYLANHPELT
jgi:hypothetical protein